MKTLSRLLTFVILSIAYWAAGAIFLFVTILPCGMGPDATCDMPGEFTIWSALIGVLLVYIAICLFFARRWIAR